MEESFNEIFIFVFIRLVTGTSFSTAQLIANNSVMPNHAIDVRMESTSIDRSQTDFDRLLTSTVGISFFM